MPNQNTVIGDDGCTPGFKYSTSKNAIHKRLRRIKGSAWYYDCVDCGAEAEHWSWIHDTDPTDIHNYEPRCVSCHQKYDDWGLKPGSTINRWDIYIKPKTD